MREPTRFAPPFSTKLSMELKQGWLQAEIRSVALSHYFNRASDKVK